MFLDEPFCRRPIRQRPVVVVGRSPILEDLVHEGAVDPLEAELVPERTLTAPIASASDDEYGVVNCGGVPNSSW